MPFDNAKATNKIIIFIIRVIAIDLDDNFAADFVATRRLVLCLLFRQHELNDDDVDPSSTKAPSLSRMSTIVIKDCCSRRSRRRWQQSWWRRDAVVVDFDDDDDNIYEYINLYFSNRAMILKISISELEDAKQLIFFEEVPGHTNK